MEMFLWWIIIQLPGRFFIVFSHFSDILMPVCGWGSSWLAGHSPVYRVWNPCFLQWVCVLTKRWCFVPSKCYLWSLSWLFSSYDEVKCHLRRPTLQTNLESFFLQKLCWSALKNFVRITRKLYVWVEIAKMEKKHVKIHSESNIGLLQKSANSCSAWKKMKLKIIKEATQL